MNEKKKEISETIEVALDSFEALADNISYVAAGAKSMFESGLTEDAIIILLQNRCKGIGRGTIKKILHGLADLDHYITK